MARRDPNISDIKRLFALSGNRCAFPKCRTPVILDGTLVGKVCHIKGANPGSARFDPSQTDDDRNSFGNLIVMCGVHHDVIDADEVSYSVDRLLKIKADHEAQIVPLSEADATQITNIYIQTTTQTPDARASRNEREIQAIERIWNTMLNLRREFGDVMLADSALSPAEMEAFFSGRMSHPIFECIAQYRDELAVMRKFNAAGVEDALRERPFVNQSLFTMFLAQQGVLCRAAMLLHLSFRARTYKNWRDDELITGHISSAVSRELIGSLKDRNMFYIQNILNEMDTLFNQLARA